MKFCSYITVHFLWTYQIGVFYQWRNNQNFRGLIINCQTDNSETDWANPVNLKLHINSNLIRTGYLRKQCQFPVDLVIRKFEKINSWN